MSGKNYKRSKNSSSNIEKRQLEYKESGQEYARITKMLGNCRCECTCNDGRTRLGIIRGNMIKRTWITLNDLVLVTLREYQDIKQILFINIVQMKKNLYVNMVKLINYLLIIY